MSYVNKTFITWQQIQDDTIKLAKQIKQDNTNINGIVCITRGGMVPCALISNLLNIKQIDLLCAFSYDKKNQHTLNVLQEPEQAKKTLGDGWIVIDELVDTGKSINYIKSILPKCKIYAVYSKIEHFINLNGYSKYYPKETWLEFPWEISIEDNVAL